MRDNNGCHNRMLAINRPLNKFRRIFYERSSTIFWCVQPFSRAFDASSPPAVAAGNPAQFFFPPGAAMPYFQGGMAYYPQPTPAAPGDPTTQQPVYQRESHPILYSVNQKIASMSFYLTFFTFLKNLLVNFWCFAAPPVYPSQTGPPQAATYPSMMFPAQTIYMPQQYPMPMPVSIHFCSFLFFSFNTYFSVVSLFLCQ